MKVSPYFIPYFFLLLPYLIMGQDTIQMVEKPPPYDSLKLLYPFLNLNQNVIAGDSAALTRFFAKLDRMKAGTGERAIVVHLGDSHVQPGSFTAPLREWLQISFGNAGTGLMFPYRMAKSNGPAGYKSQCDTPWVYGRNATLKQPLPTGIAGFTIRSASPAASFTIEFTSSVTAPADTMTLRIFHDQRDSCFFFRITNELTGHVYPVTDSLSSFYTDYVIDDLPQKIRISAMRTRVSQTSATCYGMTLENPNPGVVVHTIGVNGAMYSSYLEAAHFTTQLRELHPDLLIISLGTNEAFGVKSFTKEGFHGEVGQFIRAMKAEIPGVEIILTTPPAIYKATRKKRRVQYKPNPVAGEVREVLQKVASEESLALWDWYTIMGGKEAMAKWKAKKLTDKRYIHFTNKGYGIQGELLMEAIRECYRNRKNIIKP